MDFIIEERTSRQNNGNDLAEKRKNSFSDLWNNIKQPNMCNQSPCNREEIGNGAEKNILRNNGSYNSQFC